MQWLIDIITDLCKVYVDEQIALQAHVPSGTICLWHGEYPTIPAGWALCNGNNGTPDMRNRFVRAAGPLVALNETGGSNTHAHDFTGDGHIHSLSGSPILGPGPFIGANITSKAVTGTTDSDSNVPQYYALFFIMKL